MKLATVRLSGITFSGWTPEPKDLKSPVSREADFSDRLAAQVNGIREVTVAIGRIDVLSETRLYEVKRAADWKRASMQALAYSACIGVPSALAIFGALSVRQEGELRDWCKRVRHELLRWKVTAAGGRFAVVFRPSRWQELLQDRDLQLARGLPPSKMPAPIPVQRPPVRLGSVEESHDWLMRVLGEEVGS